MDGTTCRNCGHTVSSSDRYCPNCHAALTAYQPSDAARKLTVVLAKAAAIARVLRIIGFVFVAIVFLLIAKFYFFH